MGVPMHIYVRIQLLTRASNQSCQEPAAQWEVSPSVVRTQVLTCFSQQLRQEPAPHGEPHHITVRIQLLSNTSPWLVRSRVPNMNCFIDPSGSSSPWGVFRTGSIRSQLPTGSLTRSPSGANS